ncbi:flagella basal body P-ring formation protein FlgA [Burkholderia multivorans]
MTRTAHRSDTGRQPRGRLAFALAAALWVSTATAQAADDGMIVIPGRGETTESALAHVAAASPRTPGAASAAAAPAQAGVTAAQAGVTAAGPAGAMPAAGSAWAAAANPAVNPNTSPAAGSAWTAAANPAIHPNANPAAAPGALPGAMPAASPRAPAPAPATPAAYLSAAPRTTYAARRATDPSQIVTVVAGTPASSAAAPRAAAPLAASARLPAPRNGIASASASAAAPGQQDGEAIRRAATTFLQQQTAGLPGKTTVSVAAAFPRGLAACTTLEPFLPTGARLWGRTTVGVRCAGERPWTIYLQAKVSVTATYYVAARQIAPGEALTAADLVARDGDLTVLPLAVITDPSQAVGATALARVAAGLPLRQDMLKSAASVSIGQTVRVVAAGPGFTISTEGSVMNNAAPGQQVRVRMAAGQIVTAIVKDAGTVEIPL